MISDLISRAAAIGCLGNSPEQMCMPWSEVERMLRELPAVDAIPVEWIKARWRNKYSERAVCERWLIEDWQEEQEARHEQTAP